MSPRTSHQLLSPRLSFSALAGRSARPAVRGFNIAAIGFFLLAIPELTAILITDPAAAPKLGHLLSLFALGGIAFGLGMSVLYFFFRALGTLLGRLGPRSAALVPGCVVFLLIGEPAAAATLRLWAETTTGLQAGVLGLVAALSLGLSYLVLHVFPGVRALNAGLLLGAAVLARTFGYWSARAFYEGPPALGAAQVAGLIGMTVLVYAAWHVRHRSHMSILGDRVRPRALVWAAPLIAAGVLGALYIRALSAPPAGLTAHTAQIQSFLYITLALCFTACAQWLAGVGAVLQPGTGRGVHRSGAFWFAVMLLAVGAAALINLTAVLGDSQTARIVQRGGWASYDLFAGARLLFRPAGEKISRVPGQSEASFHCESGPCMVPVHRTQPPTGGRTPRTITLFTIGDGDGSLRRSAARLQPGESTPRFFAGTDQIPQALQKLFSGAAGHLLSNYATAGFRTICVGRSPGEHPYLGPRAAVRLDRGCQIRRAAQGDLGAVLKIAALEVGKYRERRTLTWIHYHQAPTAPLQADAQTLAAWAGAARKTNAANPTHSYSLVLFRRENPSVPLVFHLGPPTGLATARHPSTRPTVLLRQFRPSLLQSILLSGLDGRPNIVRARFDGTRLHLRDALTGASWRLD